MSDPTLARCDDEPWNQRPEPSPHAPPSPPPAAVVTLPKSQRSIYYRVTRRIDIFAAPGARARFVYDVIGGSLKPEPCVDCAGLGVIEAWQEWEWSAAEDKPGYVPRRSLDLCEACGEALRGLPLGERWQRSRKKAAVLARCIRALEAVGYTEAVEALAPLRGRRS